MALEEGPESARRPFSEPMTVPRSRGWFRRAVFGAAGAYAESAFVALLVNILALIVPLFAIIAFDQIDRFAAGEFVWRLGAGVAVVFGFDFLLRMLRSHFAAAGGAGAMARVEDRVFQRLLTTKLAVQVENGHALVADDLRDLRAMMAVPPVVALIDLPFVVLFIGAGYLIGGPVALIPMIAVPLVLFLSLLLQLPLRAKIGQMRQTGHQRLHMVEEALSGLETVKSVGSEGALQRLWEATTDHTQGQTRLVSFLAACIENLTSVAGNLVLISVLAYGAYLVTHAGLSLGGLAAVAMLATAAMAPLDRLAKILVDYHRGRAALDAIDAFMRRPVERPEGVRFAGPDRVEGAIAFQNVTFRYPDQADAALDDVSFQIGAGEKVGLVGRLGSGKSTILRLIVGLYQAESGVVAIDGFDSTQIDPVSLRAGIGYVPQQTHLFDGSVLENIALGAPSIDDAAIYRAGRLAGADAFTDKHPSGYEMPVGARGQALSGGERQTIAIARALVRDPPILLFDEPSGSLDNTSEGRLRGRLANAMGDKTLLLVTNRASMLSLVDRLIVVDGGKIVADGGKQEVLEGLQGGLIHAVQDTE